MTIYRTAIGLVGFQVSGAGFGAGRGVDCAGPATANSTADFRTNSHDAVVAAPSRQSVKLERHLCDGSDLTSAVPRAVTIVA